MQLKFILLLVLQPVLVYSQLCPNGWSLMGDSCYRLYTESSTYYEAQLICTQLGGDLAMAKTDAVNALLAGLVAQYGTSGMLGLHDLAGEGQFSWVDGTPLTDSQQHWNVGEPSNADDEDCVMMWSDATWNDYICTNNMGYFCERDNDVPLACDETDSWYSAAGKCYKFYDGPKTWQDAEQKCVDVGGNLISIGNDEEQQMAGDRANAGGITLWIGLSDKYGGAAGNYLWSSGDALGYVHWAPEQPDNSFYTLGGDCVEILTSANDGEWSTAVCTSSRAFMCERPYGTCPTGWRLFRGYCYQFNTNQQQPWTTAKFTCEAQGTYLLTSLSSAENNFIVDEMSQLVDIGVVSSWLGLSDTETDNSLSWVESSSLGYTNWDSMQPLYQTGKDDCAYVQTAEGDGKWNLDSCTTSRAYVCKVIADQPIMPLDPGVAVGTCDPGWTLFGDNCYYFDWTSRIFNEAEISCTDKTAHLTSILSEEEQGFLTMRARMGGSEQWIGLHDINTEGDFGWTDGSPVGYLNWQPNQPDNWESAEDCVHMKRGELNKGQWNDQDGNVETKASVCKRKSGTAIGRCEAGWTEFQDKCYFFEWTSRTFLDAEAACSDKGAHLTSILNQDEQDFLSLRCRMGNVYQWIGLHDTDAEGQFVWTDGSAFGFTNWASGQPDNWGSGEDHIHFRTGSESGLWNDIDGNSETMASVCKKDLTISGTSNPIGIPTPAFDARCGSGWEFEPLSGNCYLIKDGLYKSWFDAREYCQLQGGDLLSIVSKDEQLYINARLVYSTENAVWIGGNDLNSEGGWEWSDGSGFSYVNWNDNEPNNVGEEDCITIYVVSDTWNDDACNEQKGFICKKNGYLTTHFNVVPNKFLAGTGQLTASDIFPDDCAQQCVQMTSFTCKSFNYNRANKKCTFYTVTTVDPISDANTDYYERLMDVVDPVPTTLPPGYRCGTDWSSYGDNCYLIITNKQNYNDAKLTCLSQGGTLASIHDVNENSYIQSLAAQNGVTSEMWIGLNDIREHMTFEWEDNSAVDYTLWNNHEPNQNQGTAEDCIEMYNNGFWNDITCDPIRPAACKKPKEDLPPTQFPVTPSGCSFGEIAYGVYCYSASSSEKSWEDAQSDCTSSSGGNLVSVNDRYEQTVLSSLLSSEDGTLFWIGLNDKAVQGEYAWSDQTPVTYTNWDWGNPDDSKGRCVTSTSGSVAGLWRNIDCTSSQKYVCERVRDGFTPPPPVTTAAPTLPSDNGCYYNWKGYGSNCYLIVTQPLTGRTWQLAQSYCLNMNADLASFHSQAEEDYIMSFGYASIDRGYWIGLQDISSEGGFQWSDRTPVSHTNWQSGEPNNYGNLGEDCVETFFTDRRWNDQACTGLRNWICKIPKGQMPLTTPVPTTVTPWPACDTDADWIKYSGKDDNYCYFFSAGLSGSGRNRDWNDANNYCMESGGYLASVHSDDENNFIVNYLTRYGNIQPWLGMREYTTEGVYTWSDKSAVDYQNWGASEPNDANGEEQCVELYSWDGSWNDVSCGKATTFICRKRNGAVLPVTPPATPSPVGNCKTGYFRFDNRCYKIFGDEESDRKAWYDARTACRSEEGRDLVTIHRSELQTFLTSKLIDIDYNLYIGLSDTLNSGQFYWTDGSTEDYTNWNGGEPNNAGTGEDCVEIYYSENVAGKWNDIFCTYNRGYVCQTDLDPNVAPPPVETGDCSDGFTQYGTSCFQVVPGTSTFSGAQQDCQALGENVYLATISRIYEEAFAETLAHTSGGEPLWIGLYDDQETGRYLWTDKYPVWYTSWGPNEPSGGDDEGCVALSPGGWDDTACNLLYKPLCYYSLVPIPTEHPHIPGSCSESWTAYGSNCYKASNSLSDSRHSWPEAQYQCSQAGGNLASLHSKQETAFVQSMVEGGYSNVWLGLNRGDSGGFVWSDDTPVDYTNWNTGEPSYETQPGIEDCVEMFEASGKWNDLDCLRTMGYVCKTPKTGMLITTTPSVTDVIPEPPQGMSGGAIAGIVLGVIILVCSVALLAFFLTKRSSFDVKTTSPEVPGSVGFDNVLYKNDGEPNIQVSNPYSLDSKA